MRDRSAVARSDASRGIRVSVHWLLDFDAATTDAASGDQSVGDNPLSPSLVRLRSPLAAASTTYLVA